MDMNLKRPLSDIIQSKISYAQKTAIKLKSSDFQKQGTQNLLTPEKLTVRRRTQPAKDVHQRRLPGPAVPEQSRDLTFIDVEG